MCWLAATNITRILCIYLETMFFLPQMDVSSNNLQNLLVSLDFLFSVCVCMRTSFVLESRDLCWHTWEWAEEGRSQEGCRESRIRWTALRSHPSLTNRGGRFLWTGRERESKRRTTTKRTRIQPDGYYWRILTVSLWTYRWRVRLVLPTQPAELTSLSLPTAVCGSPPVYTINPQPTLVCDALSEPRRPMHGQ